MQHTRYNARRKSMSWGRLVSRAGLAILLLISVVLIIVSRYQPSGVGAVRSAVTDGTAPIVETVSLPTLWFNDFVAKFIQIIDIYDDNRQLKADNQKLLKWQMIAMKMESENIKLRKLLNLPENSEHKYVTAKIINQSVSSPHNSLIINVGRKDGVLQNHAIITPEGMIGRVVDVGKSSSHVLAITDINSRIPVRTEISQERAVLAGGGDEYPSLIYLGKKVKVQIGERVITGDDGKLLPAGLVVGEIIEIQGNKPKVQTYIDWNHLDYVSVMTNGSKKSLSKTK